MLRELVTSPVSGFKRLMRMTRAAFLPASVLPFALGVAAVWSDASALPVALGLMTAVSVHLSANLMNDWADARSGADWASAGYYGYFGGSQLIQEGRLSERAYLIAAGFFAAAALAGAAGLSSLMGSFLPAAVAAAALTVGWLYTSPPVKLAYRGLGELAVFAMFGPAAVAAGAYSASGQLPGAATLALSLPAAFSITAVLACNEVPDRASDLASGKRTLIGELAPEKGHVVYLVLALAAVASALACVGFGLVNSWTLLALLSAPPAAVAWNRLRRDWPDRAALAGASRMALAAHTALLIPLMLGAAL